MVFHANGFMIAGKPIMINSIFYHGVDTDPWPLGEPPFPDSSSWVDACFINESSALHYYKTCLEQNVYARMLFCETTAPGTKQIGELSAGYGSIRLGYDFAYTSGDYYSTIVNDIIWRETPLARKYRKELNEYGLFNEEKAVQAFIQDRAEEIKRCNDKMYYEDDKFDVIRIEQIIFP